LFASFGSLFVGYTLAVIIATLGQPSWYSSLHLNPDPTSPDYSWTNTVISCANGLFFAGGFFGALFTGAISAKIGRIGVFQIGAVIGIVGGAIQTGAVSAAMVSLACLALCNWTDAF
jgi:MFS family permease